VLLYRATLGPFLGGQCRFHPTCSQYALDVLRRKPAWRALGLIAWRLGRCQPWCKGGHDPAPVEIEDEWFALKDKG
jgi:putative membrane protein insertion efficiency factor